MKLLKNIALIGLVIFGSAQSMVDEKAKVSDEIILQTTGIKDIPDEVQMQFIGSVQGGIYDLVKYYLSKYPQLVGLKSDQKKRSMVHLAALGGFPSVLKKLLKTAADVNAIDEDGCTPLHVMARIPPDIFEQPLYEETCHTLLRSNAKVETEARDSSTPLIDAVQKGNTRLCDMLLRYCKNAEALKIDEKKSESESTHYFQRAAVRAYTSELMNALALQESFAIHKARLEVLDCLSLSLKESPLSSHVLLEPVAIDAVIQ